MLQTNVLYSRNFIFSIAASDFLLVFSYSSGAEIRTPANSDSVNSDKQKNLEEKYNQIIKKAIFIHHELVSDYLRPKNTLYTV